MIRPAPEFLRRADTFERAILVEHIGHPIGELRASNVNDETLAHCPLCDLYLRDSEGCLHIPPVGGL